MKNIKPLFIAFVLICSSAIGQTGRQKRAERLYDKFSFVKAVERYQKMIDKDDNRDLALRKLGDTYIMLRMPEKALPIYKQVVQQPNVPSEYYFYYAQTLRANGDYKESKVWMKKYRELKGKDDLRTKEFFKDGDLASGIFNNFKTHSVSKLKINTKFNEFGAVELGDKLYFASSRDEGVAIKRLYAWDQQPLLDVYVTSKENGSVASTTRLKGDVNTIYHDGSVTFNSKGNKMYFSRSNYFENKKIKDSNGTMQVGIYTADLIEGIWTNVKATNLNNPEYLVCNASLSKDGKKLYFASDMPKGFGGVDIYVSDVNSDGTLGKPENLGDIVNTEGNENFPFIHAENETLYFSSDGHVGLGLLDVFATVRDENQEIVNVINLGSPINSKKDDFTYFLSEDGLRGYVASNRNKGKVNDDIFAFKIKKCLQTIKGYVKDKETKAFLPNSKVILYADDEKIDSIVVGNDASYEFILDCGVKYKVTGEKEEYILDSHEFETSFEENLELDKNLYLEYIKPPVEEFVVVKDKILIKINPIYFDYDKHAIRLDAAIELNKVVAIMNKYPDLIIEGGSHTDTRGPSKYNESLSFRRATATVEYIISQGIDRNRISAKGYGETEPTNRCVNGVRCYESEHQLNRRTEFVVIEKGILIDEIIKNE